MHEKLPDRSFLRRHPPPDELEMKEFIEYCHKYFGIVIDASSSLNLAKSLESIPEDHNIPFLKEIIEKKLRDPFRPAKYCVTGDTTVEDFHHYALNEDCYTHFTSPIRRYADIMVHRAVEAILTQNYNDLFPLSEMIEIADCCNKKKMAGYIQDDSARTFLSIYFKNNPTIRQDCVIFDMRNTFFEVHCIGLNLTFRMYFDNMTKKKIDEEQIDLSWEEDGVKYRKSYKKFSKISCILKLKMKNNIPLRPLDIDGKLCRYDISTYKKQNKMLMH